MVSSVTFFKKKNWVGVLVFIGLFTTFSEGIASLTLFALIPHPFQWKNVTLFAHFV